jgi:hypothetical protein
MYSLEDKQVSVAKAQQVPLLKTRRKISPRQFQKNIFI